MDEQTESLKSARIVHPGRIVLRYLEARQWAQKYLAEKINRPYQVVNELIQGKKAITAHTALDLAEAFETSPEMWLNLEMRYQLAKAQEERKMKYYIVRMMFGTEHKHLAYSLKPGYVTAHKSDACHYRTREQAEREARRNAQWNAEVIECGSDEVVAQEVLL